MAEKKEEKSKTKEKKRPSTKKWSFYKVEGAAVKRKKTCPKCGPGVFMAEHAKRSHCGKCGYTEFR